jgi:hypothetical protein
VGGELEIMANAKKESWVMVSLSLTEEEARYIKAMVQNPIVPEDEESERSMKLRETIFLALSEVV